MLAAPAAAGPFEDGVAAEARGDAPAAVVAYRAAADAGQAPAQFALGRLYRAGEGVPRDPALAAAWFRKAAMQDNPGAEFALASMFEAGAAEARDSTEAAQWCLKAAGHGYAPAEANLADLYQRGDGVAKDLSVAIHWAASAAQQGDIAEQFRVGALYVERARRPPDGASGLTAKAFSAVMDKVFGHDRWRETSGYRSQRQENALRAEGALTVPAGTLSRHSMGTREAPGAYDVVVTNMSTGAAAMRLLRSGVRFRRVFAEGAHGPEGPHLHVEPAPGARLDPPVLTDTSADDAAGVALETHSPASDYQSAGYWLTVAARHGNADAAKLLASLPAGAARGP